MQFDLSEYLQELRDIDSRRVIRESMVQDKARISQLEAMVGYLMVLLLRQGVVSLDDKNIRHFLKIPRKIEDPEKALQLVLSKLQPHGLLVCKKCGAKCKDIPGFTDEECIFCGANIGSKE